MNKRIEKNILEMIVPNQKITLKDINKDKILLDIKDIKIRIIERERVRDAVMDGDCVVNGVMRDRLKTKVIISAKTY